MPKKRTHQATDKRYKKTKNGKNKRRYAGQGHYNRRDGGKKGRQKRRPEFASTTIDRILQINL